MRNNESNWSFINNVYDGFKNSDAILILTEWEEYSQINWEEAASLMRKPAWVFDARSIINFESIKKENFNFWRIGDGTITKNS